MFGTGKLHSQVLRDVPYAVITLVTYEILQAYVTKRVQRRRLLDARNVQPGVMKAEVVGSNPTEVNKNAKNIQDGICGGLAGVW